MRTSTNEAFLLLEGWKAEDKALQVVAALTEGTALGARFNAVISSVSKSEESLILRADVQGELTEVPFDLSGAVFEYVEPREIAGPGTEGLLCFLKADLPDGGAIMFLVPR